MSERNRWRRRLCEYVLGHSWEFTPREVIDTTGVVAICQRCGRGVRP